MKYRKNYRAAPELIAALASCGQVIAFSRVSIAPWISGRNDIIKWATARYIGVYKHSELMSCS
jgi:hypothetical protein